MEYGFLSIIPPLLALGIAFKTKKASFAIFLGAFLGCLIISSWNPFTGMVLTVETILDTCTSKGNLKVFLFTSLMGAFVFLMKVSGGVEGFVNYLTVKNKKIKNKVMAQILAYFIGVIIFIDGLMGIMFKGVVMLPIFDKFKISREKLAYINDSTSAPINAIIPLNSWGAMLIGLISTQIADGFIEGDATALLFGSLKYQFYSIIALVMVLAVILSGRDWGYMKRAETRVQTTGKLYDDGVVPLMNTEADDGSVAEAGKENMLNMMLPLIILIGCTFAGLLISGKGSLIKGDGTTSILYSVCITLTFMCIYYTRQKLMTVKDYVNYLYKGISSMLSLVVLLVLAFAIGSVISKLGTGVFLASLVGGHISGAFTPVIIFVLGTVISFSTGTSWGTFSILMPIAIPMAAAMDANILMTIGAVVSGGIFGDHCSPISDTTILSSMTAGTDLMSHTKTQLPYAVLSAIIAAILYVIMGFVL